MKEPLMISGRPLSASIALGILGSALCLGEGAFARDSAHYVCSAIGEFRDGEATTQIGISIDFFDQRAENGNARKYVLSSVYQGKLFQGSMIDRSDKFGQGSVTLKNGRSQFYAGSFKLEQQNGGGSYAMSLDGKITDDPNSRKSYPVKATLPCVDLSI
jgi:hypothetical protein